ncbi:hypothetical protein I6B53_03350 [Schaalia sp. 19OD2882]|uniref:hypothetical protein n=1 Tax=Schaalia sp. 19OD2882 TaxID=2794089 RepID=UPI001C1E94E0|nr:hypothetical protein [Schaalia sp. 19OD2882]QWW20147.1 hypothetical protein I6B53_03350 [Schaalia sp. 19OD2882]
MEVGSITMRLLIAGDGSEDVHIRVEGDIGLCTQLGMLDLAREAVREIARRDDDEGDAG